MTQGDKKDSITNTPRTDAAEYESIDEPCAKLGAVDADFARQLERELNAANDRIKVLEEAYAATEAVRTINGCWCNNHPDVWIRCSSCCDKKKRYYAAKANLHRTDKAKEAKP